MDRQWLPLIRAAYHLNDSPDEWLRELAKASLRPMDCGVGVIAFHYAADEHNAFVPREIVHAAEQPSNRFDDFEEFLEGLPEQWRPFYSIRPAIHHTFSELVLSTESSIEEPHNIDVQQALESALEDTDFIDALITSVQLDDTQGVVLVAPAQERLDPTLINRARWASIAQHIRSGWHLIQRLESGVNRTALHTSSSQARHNTSMLFPILKTSEEASSVRERPTPALWDNLLTGKTSIVDSYTEHLRGRHYILLENRPQLVDSRALTDRERNATIQFVQTASGADVAVELDIAKGTVRQYLRSAMIKLGLIHRSELLQLAFATGFLRRKTTAADLRPPQRPTHHAVRRQIDDELSILSVPLVPSSHVLRQLTDAECELCRYVMLGWSTEQMAQQRDTSKRTISNQLSSIFRKLEITDRFELTNRLLGAREDGSHIVN